ncbi:MAG: hypothetical protein ACRC6I_15010 [Paracoccaceae bacterium]
MNDSRFLTRSVLLAGDEAALLRFAAHFSIAPDHMFIDRQPDNFDFMERHENHMQGAAIMGDFRYGFDVFLWDRDLATFESDLIALSSQGMTISLDDEHSPSPCAAHLYHRGERVAAEIVDDEVTDETWIHKPSDIRKELPLPPSA